MSVDLSSGINLYPDLRIVNNDSLYYQKSIEVIKNVIDKMAILGADELFITTQRTIENNYTMEQFYQSLQETYQLLADYAKNKNIMLILKQTKGRTPDSIKELLDLCKKVDRDNFCFAPSLALLLIDFDNWKENMGLLQNEDMHYLFLSIPEKDIHQQLWNLNAPVFKSKQIDMIQQFVEAFSNANIIFDCLYQSEDEEYKDVKMFE